MFTLSVAENVRLNATNTIYSKQVEVSSLDDLCEAVQWDHVAGTFTNNERGNDNFINADCVIMDCDNTHSNEPEAWLTPEGLASRLQNVSFFVVFSKSHMKAKGGHAPASRYHIYFPLSKSYAEAAQIAYIKQALLRLIPEFDAGAKDAARFFFGVQVAQCVGRTGGHQCIRQSRLYV